MASRRKRSKFISAEEAVQDITRWLDDATSEFDDDSDDDNIDLDDVNGGGNNNLFLIILFSARILFYS